LEDEEEDDDDLIIRGDAVGKRLARWVMGWNTEGISVGAVVGI
jgi:hypothetical protein